MLCHLCRLPLPIRKIHHGDSWSCTPIGLRCFTDSLHHTVSALPVCFAKEFYSLLHICIYKIIVKPFLQYRRSWQSCTYSQCIQMVDNGIRDRHPSAAKTGSNKLGEAIAVYNAFVISGKFQICHWRLFIVTQVMIRIIFKNRDIIFLSNFQYSLSAFERRSAPAWILKIWDCVKETYRPFFLIYPPMLQV